MLKRFFLKSAVAAAAAAITACASVAPPADVVETVARTPELSTLSGLIQQSGLADTLHGAGPFTLFAPSNEAFKAVPPATLSQLASDKELLRSILSFHLLPGKLNSADVKNGAAKSVQGASLALSKSGTFVTVEDAVVQTPDLPATNGVVHIVDRVLMPPKK